MNQYEVVPYTDRLTETERLNNKISFFELAPMIHSLRALILRSRPLKTSDITLPNQATKAQEEQISIDLKRINLPQAGLNALKNKIEPFKIKLENLVKDPNTNRIQILANLENHITEAIDLLTTASSFGIPQSGWGFVLDWKRLAFIDLLDRVRELTVRWQDRLTQFDAKLVEYTALSGTATDQERFTLLQQAERLVSIIITIPQPATPNDLRTIILLKGSIAVLLRIR
jgi:hypothetical protein